MTAPTSLPAARAREDENALRRCLEGALEGRASRVTDIRRERSAFASSYGAEIVSVRTAAGEVLTCFLKDFSAIGFPKDDPARRRECERGVYRELLADAQLGTATYYGSEWDDARGRYWLLLEFVRGCELRACELDYWIGAAAWLGRMHAHFARREARLRACSFLARHDADYFGWKAERAAQELRQVADALAGRVEHIIDRYRRAAAVMVRQPCTLVHGHFRPCNVLVAGDTVPARICPVDWEQAALGAGLYDVALLTDGFGEPELSRLLDAYRREALAHGLDVPGGEELRAVLACFGLHIEVTLLGRARERRFSRRKVTELARQVEQRARALGALGGDA